MGSVQPFPSPLPNLEEGRVEGRGGEGSSPTKARCKSSIKKRKRPLLAAPQVGLPVGKRPFSRRVL